MPTRTARDEMIGLSELAKLCGVRPRTAYQWNYRRVAESGTLPAPDGSIGGRPIWRRSRLVRWARSTGRLAA